MLTLQNDFAVESVPMVDYSNMGQSVKVNRNLTVRNCKFDWDDDHNWKYNTAKVYPNKEASDSFVCAGH